MTLVWQQEELQSEWTLTNLATSSGDPEISHRSLPIQLYEDSIVALIEANSVAGIKAETGSGKTMLGPGYLSRVVHGRPVVIVQKSCYAAASVYASLKDRFGWPEGRLHLLTGQHPEEAEFNNRWTLFSIITYGVLFKWLFS